MQTTSELKQRLRFRDVLKHTHPDHWTARGNVKCPFHRDRVPSMQINPDSGFCHTCDQNYDIFDIWKLRYSCGLPEALTGLSELAGYVNAPKAPRDNSIPRRKTHEYNYVDEGGAVLYRVERWEPKDFRQKSYRAGKWVYNMTGVRRVLYHLPEVLEAKEVIIVGGEKDADRLRKLGYCATTCSEGEKKKNWIKQCENHLIHIPLKGKKVTVIPDNDATGIKHAQDIVKTLEELKIDYRLMMLPDMLDHGDSSTFIDSFGEERFRQEYKKAWERRRTGLEVQSCKELWNKDIPEPVWIVEDILAEGLCVFAGGPKLGKSWTAFHLTLSVAGGTPFMGNFPVNQGRALYFALEDHERRAKSRLTKLMKVHDKQCLERADLAYSAKRILGPKDSGLSLKDQVVDWVESTNGDAKLVVLDTLQMVRPSRSRKDIYAEDYEDLVVLRDLAQQLHIAIICVHHTNKSKDNDSMHSISGSFGIGGTADTIWVLKRLESASMGTLYCRGRDVLEETYKVNMDWESGVWECKGTLSESQGKSKPGHLDTIYKLLLNMPNQKAHVDTIEEMTGVKRSSLLAVLSRAAKEKVKIQKPWGSKDGWYQAIRPDDTACMDSF